MVLVDMEFSKNCSQCKLRKDESKNDIYCSVTGRYIENCQSKPEWCPIVGRFDINLKDLESKISEVTKQAFSIRAVEAMKDSKLTENMKHPFHTFDSELKPPSEWNKDKK